MYLTTFSHPHIGTTTKLTVSDFTFPQSVSLWDSQPNRACCVMSPVRVKILIPGSACYLLFA